jgi:hypothetical protein
VSFWSKLFGTAKPETRTTTASNPLRLSRPRIGFLNLLGARGATLAEADRALLAPLFAASVLTTDATLKCEVLFVYCAVDAKGRIQDSRLGVRELAEAAGAYVAVVATENPPRNYMALGPRGAWGANLVLVIDRKAEKFALFFYRLFELMFKGESMLMAWVQLVPQVPGLEHPDAPGSIMAAEAGHITFDG